MQFMNLLRNQLKFLAPKHRGQLAATSHKGGAIAITAMVLISLSMGCSSNYKIEPPLVDPPRYDFGEILFKEGAPVSSSSELISQLLDPKSAADSVRLIMTYIRSDQNVKFGIVGFTDKKECEIADCVELSNRRASSFFKFLLSKGIPRENLVGWVGEGSKGPVDFSDTESQRMRNRRVEIRSGDHLSELINWRNM